MIKHSNKEEQVVKWCLFTSPSNSHSSIVFLLMFVYLSQHFWEMVTSSVMKLTGIFMTQPCSHHPPVQKVL